MPLLETLCEHSAGIAAQGHTERMAQVATIGSNLLQGLGVVQNVVVQAQASNSDDPGLIAALQTASRAPIQGANDLAK